MQLAGLLAKKLQDVGASQLPLARMLLNRLFERALFRSPGGVEEIWSLRHQFRRESRGHVVQFSLHVDGVTLRARRVESVRELVMTGDGAIFLAWQHGSSEISYEKCGEIVRVHEARDGMVLLH